MLYRTYCNTFLAVEPTGVGLWEETAAPEKIESAGLFIKSITKHSLYFALCSLEVENMKLTKIYYMIISFWSQFTERYHVEFFCCQAQPSWPSSGLRWSLLSWSQPTHQTTHREKCQEARFSILIKSKVVCCYTVRSENWQIFTHLIENSFKFIQIFRMNLTISALSSNF